MKIEGLAEMRRRMRAIPREARVTIRRQLDKNASEIVANARRFAPTRTGALKRSIDKTFGKYTANNGNVRSVGGGGSGVQDPDLTVTIHAGDATAWYAALVEFGTAPHDQPNNPRSGHHHPGASAHPYFFPAWRLGKRRAKSGLARAIKRAAQKAASGSGR